MLDVLRAQGLTDLEFMAVTWSDDGWEWHVEGYEQIDFPVMPDTVGVYYVYGANVDDVMLVDKKGRLVTKVNIAAANPATGMLTSTLAESLNKKIRELHLE